MYRETNARVLRTIGLTILFSISSTAQSAPTGWIGGSGGSSQKTVSCPNGQYITSINIRYGDVVDRMSIKCQSISDQGTYASGTHNSNYIGNLSGHGNNNLWVNCPNNKFVGAAYATVKPKPVANTVFQVINGITLGCFSSDQQWQQVGSPSKVSGVSSSQSVNWQTCRNKGLASGITVKSGWWVDRFRLECRDPQATTSLSAADPRVKVAQLAKPAINIPREFLLGVRWDKRITSADVRNYRLHSTALGKTMREIWQSKGAIRSDGQRCSACHHTGGNPGLVPSTGSSQIPLNTNVNITKQWGCWLADKFSGNSAKPGNLQRFIDEWHKVDC